MILANDGGALPNFSSIQHLTAHLQNLPSRYHWAWADEALLRAIPRNEDVARGARGRRLRGLVALGKRLGLVWLLVWLVGLVELTRLVLGQGGSRRNGAHGKGRYPARFLVGFGAGSEEPIFRKYCKDHPGKVGRLDQINVASFAEWHRVGALQALRSLHGALALAREAVDALPPELTRWRPDFLTFIGMRVGYFAYMHAWFEGLKTRAGEELEEIVFLAADTAAFAAVEAKLPTCYHQHGLIPCAVLPEFARVETLTADEAAFFRSALPSAHISLRPKPRQALTPAQLSKEILVASIYGDAEYMARIGSVIAWAKSNKIPVRVRPHPCEAGTFWSAYEAKGDISIEKSDAGIVETIDRLRPRLVVSWFSTVLAEALEQDIAPVTVCEEGDRNAADMVYPLFRRCLRWPQDADMIQRLMIDDEFYESILSRLRAEPSEVTV